MATLKQRLHRKNGTSYDTIHLETNATVVKMSTTDSTTVSSKLSTVDNSINNLGTEMSSLKSSVSSGKAQIASAITDKGVSTSASDSFSQMATNISQIRGGISGVPVYGTDFTYSGDYQVINDGNDNWRIKFLTSGTFTALTDMLIDVFLVGGGAKNNVAIGYSGGGGGYTYTTNSITLFANTQYPIVVGTGGTGGNNGGDSSAFNANCSGGRCGNGNVGGNGGSGGGGSGYTGESAGGGDGGSDGSDGTRGGSGNGGTGQGTTTREFGKTGADLYSGGGAGGTKTGSAGSAGAGGGGSINNPAPANYGGGGYGGRGSSTAPGSGGSGIVIIRNSQ